MACNQKFTVINTYRRRCFGRCHRNFKRTAGHRQSLHDVCDALLHLQRAFFSLFREFSGKFVVLRLCLVRFIKERRQITQPFHLSCLLGDFLHLCVKLFRLDMIFASQFEIKVDSLIEFFETAFVKIRAV